MSDSGILNSKRAQILSVENIANFIKGLPFKAQIILRKIVRLHAGSLELTIPDGRTFLIKGRKPGPAAALVLHNWNVFHRALSGGTIGVAESYMDGDWDSQDIGIFLELFLVNQDVTSNFTNGARGILRIIERLRHWMNNNTKSGSKRNISAHYDLGNAFYQAWLDPSMTYSAALYAEGVRDLQSAQRAKYKALAEATGIRAGDRVLEIGCGWGGFAHYAASEIGCHVTGLTISGEQLAFAKQRIEKAGLEDRVSLKFQDYRDEQDSYDRIISIEMFEAVGEKYWPVYFDKLRACLKPGGTAGLQIITIDKASFEEYRSNPDFIQKYVFPGGMLPTAEHLVGHSARVGLSMVSNFGFGPDYARTLSEWRDGFRAAWDQIEPLGFDMRFKRLWEFYLHYCEAGFRAGNIDVRQIVYA